jgi:hypothetical protein
MIVDKTLFNSFSESTFKEPSGKKRKGSNGEQIESMMDEQDLSGLVRSQIPLIVPSLLKHFSSSVSIETIQACYMLLKALCKTSRGGLDETLISLMPAIQSGLVSRQAGSVASLTNTNIKIEVLDLIGIIIEFHDVDVLVPHLTTLADCLVDATLDKFYKVSHLEL